MIIEKSLEIWMDHQDAHLMEFTTDPIETTTVESKFTHQEKEQTLHRSENLMHNKERHEEAGYYKALGEIIRNYKMSFFSGRLMRRLNCSIFCEKIIVSLISSLKLNKQIK